MIIGNPNDNARYILDEKFFCPHCGQYVSQWTISRDGKYQICREGHEILITTLDAAKDASK